MRFRGDLQKEGIEPTLGLINVMWSLEQSFVTCFSVLLTASPHPAFLDFFFLISTCHKLLMPQIYCVSVYVMWPFGDHKINVISKISLAYPPETIVVLLGAILHSLRKHDLAQHLTHLVRHIDFKKITKSQD